MTIAAGAALHTVFAAGPTERWCVDSITAIRGDTLPSAPCLTVVECTAARSLLHEPAAQWALRGFTSSTHYMNRNEAAALAVEQPVGSAARIGDI